MKNSFAKHFCLSGWARIVLLSTLLSSFHCLTTELAAQTTDRQPIAIGSKLPDFQLKDFRGKDFSQDDFAKDKSTVVIFFGLECPLARLYAPRLNEIQSE